MGFVKAPMFWNGKSELYNHPHQYTLQLQARDHIHLYFFLLKISPLFHWKKKIKALVWKLKLHLADLFHGRIKWFQFIYRSESDQLASEKNDSPVILDITVIIKQYVLNIGLRHCNRGGNNYKLFQCYLVLMLQLSQSCV